MIKPVCLVISLCCPSVVFCHQQQDDLRIPLQVERTPAAVWPHWNLTREQHQYLVCNFSMYREFSKMCRKYMVTWAAQQTSHWTVLVMPSVFICQRCILLSHTTRHWTLQPYFGHLRWPRSINSCLQTFISLNSRKFPINNEEMRCCGLYNAFNKLITRNVVTSLEINHTGL